MLLIKKKIQTYRATKNKRNTNHDSLKIKQIPKIPNISNKYNLICIIDASQKNKLTSESLIRPYKWRGLQLGLPLAQLMVDHLIELDYVVNQSLQVDD